MKENWINKLINLINEYEQLNMCRKFDNFAMHTFEDSSWVDRLLEDTVISARYGFIKRLIENNKIDLDKAYLENCCMCWWFIRYGEVNGLIMKLSISDNPISDLISYLK